MSLALTRMTSKTVKLSLIRSFIHSFTHYSFKHSIYYYNYQSNKLFTLTCFDTSILFLITKRRELAMMRIPQSVSRLQTQAVRM